MVQLDWLETTATKESVRAFKEALLRFKITGKTLPVEQVLELLIDMSTCPTNTNNGVVCLQCTHHRDRYDCEYTDDCRALDTAARQLSGVYDIPNKITILYIKEKGEQHTKNPKKSP